MQPIDLNWLSDQLVFVNIDITNWSGKTPDPEDLGLDRSCCPGDPGLAGDKQLIDPEALKTFGSIRARPAAGVWRWGTRFMGGYAVPAAKAPALLAELDTLDQRYQDARAAFRPATTGNWRPGPGNSPLEWQKLIQDALVPAEYVGGRLSFAVQAVRFAAPDPKG